MRAEEDGGQVIEEDGEEAIEEDGEEVIKEDGEEAIEEDGEEAIEAEVAAVAAMVDRTKLTSASRTLVVEKAGAIEMV
ncbi:hypothetical protein BGZ74_005563 [Mortierella antarctica]|nr:hypothetical protein BGZ74_005563 [Mortierella antarctica]